MPNEYEDDNEWEEAQKLAEGEDKTNFEGFLDDKTNFEGFSDWGA